MDWPLTLVVALSSSGVISALVAAMFARRKTSAETISIEVSTLRAALEEMRIDNADAHKRVDVLEEKLDKAQLDLRILSNAFDKLQQEFLEAERAKELLQAAVVERDKIILALRGRITELDTERDRIISSLRGRIVELEAQVATLKEKVNGTV